MTVILAALGLLLLIFFPFNSIKEVTIREISGLPLDTSIKIQGIITGVYKTKEVMIFNVTDQTSTVKVVLFKPGNTKLADNLKIEVTGIIKAYKNSVEIHAIDLKNA